ncbi:radical SAM family heme chaperone HemW [Arenimonas sp. MALMAid1274]|uniref:radical SAM family heme chaperone HemW n=1 Tax=Arenimonas sp. MALMAid1274 TaxID=3411630 RepID=UPI003B9E2DE7
MLIPPPLSLYIHIPWCVKKCPYCDFNSHGQSGALPVAEYVQALVRDLEQDLPLVWGRPVHSVFFGGGTPSLFAPEAIGAILDACAARLRFTPGAEITMECNPGTAEHGRFEQYRAAGVNRISFGIQSFDDGCLQRLGRIHDSGEAERAVKLAQDAGYDNLNLDLMYALPGQDLAMAMADVERAIALQPAHVSHYQLTMEPNTAFAVKPPAGLPDEDSAWDIQERCVERLEDAGYAAYEVSAYARPGRQCAHNLNYWRFGDYLGIGAGAHGKISSGATGEVLRRWKPKNPRDYLAHAGTAAGIGGDDVISPANLPFDYMLNALRLVDGFSLRDFESRTGLDRSAIVDELSKAQNLGWLDLIGDRIRPTELGRRFTNDVIALFLH